MIGMSLIDRGKIPGTGDHLRRGLAATRNSLKKRHRPRSYHAFLQAFCQGIQRIRSDPNTSLKASEIRGLQLPSKLVAKHPVLLCDIKQNDPPFSIPRAIPPFLGNPSAHGMQEPFFREADNPAGSLSRKLSLDKPLGLEPLHLPKKPLVVSPLLKRSIEVLPRGTKHGLSHPKALVEKHFSFRPHHFKNRMKRVYH